MSLYNYFNVKGVSKSSIKKEIRPELEFANGDSGLKSAINDKQDIQPEQNVDVTKFWILYFLLMFSRIRSYFQRALNLPVK
jgi:hypothetical protein